MTEEQLAEIRVYKPAEVAKMLNIPITRLEIWAREDRVPHLRAGVSRGVEYTAEDIRVIARMLPELMGGRRGGRIVAANELQEVAAAAAAMPSAETIAGWVQLKAHRPTSRRPSRGS
jgi:hypothetical protein